MPSGGCGAHGLRHLQRIGFLFKDAVDLRRAALSIDRERIGAFGRQPSDKLGHEAELQAGIGLDRLAFRHHASDQVGGGMAIEEGRPGELGHG